MPAKVDAEDRRRRLVLAAAELIADEGINALTNGKIAKRLSGSTTMVTHYFPSKRELVLDTYQTMASRSRARVEQAMRESDDPLAACLRALLPLDDSTRLEWRVWLAYQGDPPRRGRRFSGTHVVKHRPGHRRRPPVCAGPRDVVPVHRRPGAVDPRAPAPDRRPGTPATSPP
jgi:AcrR family transcriptional regulator